MSLHFMIAFAATSAAGPLMIASGLHKRLLERTRHRCPRCGRGLSGRTCFDCAQRHS